MDDTNQRGMGGVGGEGTENPSDWSGYGGFWGDILKTGIKDIATPILNAQFGGPQPGQYFGTGPNGQRVAYNVPINSASINAFPGVNFSSGTSSVLPWILIIGGVLVVGSLFSRGK